MKNPKKKNPEISYFDTLLDNGVDIEDRVLYLEGEIEEYENAEFVRAFHKLSRKSDDPIIVVINSPGGSIYDGLGLYDIMEFSSCPIITVGLGKIMSMATVLFCAGDERYLYKNSTAMFHELSTWIAGELTDINIEQKECKRLEKLVSGILGQKTNKESSYWKRFKKNTYFDPKKCLETGFATHILEKGQFDKLFSKNKKK